MDDEIAPPGFDYLNAARLNVRDALYNSVKFPQVATVQAQVAAAQALISIADSLQGIEGFLLNSVLSVDVRGTVDIHDVGKY